MNTWESVMALEKKDNRHKGLANTLSQADILTVLGTMEFFGASDCDMAQARFDLGAARFRVFDWLAMGVQGRIECRTAVKVLVRSFLRVDGDVTAFIEDLRYTDYDVDHSWEAVEL